MRAGKGMGTKLSPKQRLFVDEYLIDFNASAAARRAGYSPKTAFRMGQENMQKPAIQAVLQLRMADREKRTEITQDRVLQEYARLAFLDPRQFSDAEGNLTPLHKLSADAAAAVTGFDAKRIIGEGEGEETCEILKYKFADKRASLADVAKHLGMFEKDNAQKGNHEILVTVENDSE